MRLSRQVYWSELPFPSLGDLPWPRNQTWVSCITGKFSTHLYSWPQTQKDSIEHVHFGSKFLIVWNHLNSPGAEFSHFGISVLNIHWKDWCQGLWPPDGKNWLIWKDPDAGKDWKQEKKEMMEDEVVGWHHRLDGHEFEQALGVGDGQGGLACCSPWGHKESDMTEQLNWQTDWCRILASKNLCGTTNSCT